MHVGVLDPEGAVAFDRNRPTLPDALLRALAPFRDGLVLGVECIFAWYWLVDLSRREGIPFALGHARYMMAIHGGKAKNDCLDAGKIARLMRGGTFPLAYALPQEVGQGARGAGLAQVTLFGAGTAQVTLRR
jgi:hypothetical protein